MRTTRQLTFGMVGVVAAMSLAGALFIWPNYNEARSVRAQVQELEGRLAGLGDRAHAVERLAEQVKTAQQQVLNEFKIIPETADVAGLIRKLSYEIDGVTVTDQTFTAGSPADAMFRQPGNGAKPAGGAEITVAQAMPVTADLTATFDSVLALIDKAEGMRRLVRVTSVRIMCQRDDQKVDVPLLKASIGLEVIYDPMASLASAEEGGQENR